MQNKIEKQNSSKKQNGFLHSFRFTLRAPRYAQSGFVVLFTVLLTSIILAIAIGASGIAYKEVVLASAAKESNYAFYAADTGLECALYWDVHHSPSAFADNSTLSIPCDSTNNINLGDPLYNTAGTLYSFPLSLDNGNSCAQVTVDKHAENNTATQITSQGYNVSCTDVENARQSLSDTKIVERAEGVTYPN